jgi:hypothetical protein
MAKTIPQLTDATTVNAADELIIQQGGITKRATATELFNGTATVTSTGSTAGRTLKNRFADVVNVKDFGATGDGVTDDTAAFQAALLHASNNKFSVLIPNGVFVISAVLTANVPVEIHGYLKCGYNHTVAGIKLLAQPIQITNYMHIYANGAFQADSPTIGTAALRAAIDDWLRHYPGFKTLDLQGWRIFVNEEIIIDADIVFGLSGDYNQRRFLANGKIQAVTFAGAQKNVFRLTSTSGNERIQYIRFDRLSFDLDQKANAVICESGYYQISFVNCVFRNPLNFSIKFSPPAGASQSDVMIDACTLIGNIVSPPQNGIYYCGNDVSITDTIIAYHQYNIQMVACNAGSGQGAGLSIIDSCHLYISDEGIARRDPNILFVDCTNTNVTNCYIDNGPVLYKNDNNTNCTDHSVSDNSFLMNVSDQTVGGWGAALSFVEIETNDATAAVARISIIGNKFINGAFAETITTPFRVYGSGISTNAAVHGENIVKLNQFLFVTFMATEVPVTLTFSSSTSQSISVPTWLVPFGLPIKGVKQIVPYFTGNPQGVWISGTAPNFTLNTGTSVSGSPQLLLTTSAIHY